MCEQPSINFQSEFTLEYVKTPTVMIWDGEEAIKSVDIVRKDVIRLLKDLDLFGL